MKRLFNFYSFLFNFRLSKNSFRRGKIYFDRKWKNRYKSIFERGIKNEYLFLPPSQKKTYFDVTTRQHREFFNNKLQHSCSPLYTHIATNQRVTSSVYSSLFLSFSLLRPPRILHWISIRRKNYYLRSPFAQAETVRFLKRDTVPPPLRCRSIFASSSLLPPKKLPFHFGHKETSYFK